MALRVRLFVDNDAKDKGILKQTKMVIESVLLFVSSPVLAIMGKIPYHIGLMDGTMNLLSPNAAKYVNDLKPAIKEGIDRPIGKKGEFCHSYTF